MTREIWKDIEGYNGRYQISNQGRVRSFCRSSRNTTSRPRFLTPYIRNGYLHIALSNPLKTFKIHRTVLYHFKGKPKKKQQGNHINGIKADNRIKNLEWVTCQENIRHAFRLGLKKGDKGPRVYRRKLIKQISIVTGKVVNIWTGAVEAGKQLNICSYAIRNCLYKKTKTSAGFKWEFVIKEGVE